MTVKDYFLVHAALDNIDLALRSKRDYFLGQIRSDDLTLYSYVNAVRTLLSTQRSSSSSCWARSGKSTRVSRST